MKILKLGYRIRAARIEELSLLAHIEQSASILFLDTPYAWLATAESLPLEFVQQQFHAGLVWVAVDLHETVVGYAVAGEVDQTLYLQQIDVLPKHGHRGIGSALVNTICEHATQQDYEIVSLSTFRDIPWNAPFYSTFGFSPVAETELTPGFQQIRLKELAAGLPIADRIIMHRNISNRKL
jgi:predicted N-acetyltransferase YhbS